MPTITETKAKIEALVRIHAPGSIEGGQAIARVLAEVGCTDQGEVEQITQLARLKVSMLAGADPQRCLEQLPDLCIDEADRARVTRIVGLHPVLHAALSAKDIPWTVDTYAAMVETRLQLQAHGHEVDGRDIDLAVWLARIHALGQPDRARELFDRCAGMWPQAAGRLRKNYGVGAQDADRCGDAIAEARRRLQAGAGDRPQGQPRTVWLYWEGPKPEWITACHETIYAHAADVRLVTPEEFDRMRDVDRDIDLSGLCVAHRADFIRAFFLMRYGGLWIDSDCLVMKSLEPILDLLRDHDFLGYRDRTLFLPNNFIGAAAGSEVALALYIHICETLRSGRFSALNFDMRIQWNAIGSDPITNILRHTMARWHALPMASVDPFSWTDTAVFFTTGTPAEHEARFNPEALCYMLSGNWVSALQAAEPGADLMAEGTFFRYLLERSMQG